MDKFEGFMTIKLNVRILHFWRYSPVRAAVFQFFPTSPFQKEEGEGFYKTGLSFPNLKAGLTAKMRTPPKMQKREAK